MSALAVALTYTSGSSNGTVNSTTASNPTNNFPDYNGITINAVVSGGSQLYSYGWTSTATNFTSPGNVTSITFTAPINHNKNGTYTFTVTDQANNTQKSVSFALTFYSALSLSLTSTLGGTPISGFSIQNVNQQLMVNAVISGGDASSTNYVWIDSNNSIVSTAASFSPTQIGTYTLSVNKASSPLSKVSTTFTVTTSFNPTVTIKLNNQTTSDDSFEVVESMFDIVANINLPNYPYSNVNAILQSGSTVLFKGLVALLNNATQITFANFKPLTLPAQLSLSLYSASGFLITQKTTTISTNLEEKKVIDVLVLSDLIFRQFSKLLPPNIISRF